MKKIPIHIKAINPGYTENGTSNVGEFIELARDMELSDTQILLAGLKVGYINSSGNLVILAEFPDDSWMIGESILLRLSSSSESELAHLTYSKTLAMKAGPIQLIYEDEIIDSVCWTGEEGCYEKFSSSSPTVLLYAGDKYVHVTEYKPEYVPENYIHYEPEPEEQGGLEYEVELELNKGSNQKNESESEHLSKQEMVKKPSQCQGLEFSEIYSYFEEEKSEQFIELYNNTKNEIILDGCKIQYKNKKYDLSGKIAPMDYYLYHPANNFSLTKNPTSENSLKIIDTNDEEISEQTYALQKKSASYAKMSDGLWQITYARTPGTQNIYQKYQSCAEGYEINEDTGRCKKIVVNTAADFPIVKEEYTEETSFTALYAIIAIVILAIAYIIFQFRKEFKKFFIKTGKFFNKPIKFFDKVFRRFLQKLHRG